MSLLRYVAVRRSLRSGLYSVQLQEAVVGFRRDDSAAGRLGTPTMIGATISTSEGMSLDAASRSARIVGSSSDCG
jgi:hypothetical protein